MKEHVYDPTKIRPIPDTGYWLTRSGVVWKPFIKDLFMSRPIRGKTKAQHVPGYLSVCMNLGRSAQQPVLLPAVSTYKRVWGELPPHDLWLNGPTVWTDMTVSEAQEASIVESYALAEPASHLQTAQIVRINELLIEVCRDHGIDPIKEMKKKVCQR